MKKMLAIMLVLCSTVSAFAIRFENGENVQISTPVNEDLYIAGGTISANAIIRGDLFVAGGTISLNDTISGDLVAAGGTVTVRSVVMDDVRVMGGSLMFSGYIGGDLLVTGGSVTIESGTIIAGDVYVAGGTVRMNGSILGSLKSTSGEIFLNGGIGKNADLNGDKIRLNGKISGETVIICRDLEVQTGASLEGNLRYWTEKGEVNFGSAMKNGAATYDLSLKDKFQAPKPQYLGFITFFGVLGYLVAMFILLALGQRLFGPLFRKITGTIQSSPMRALGYGFLYFVAVPVAIVLLFITLVGIPVALIGLTFYLLLLLLAHSITALALTNWFIVRRGYSWGLWRTALVALGILVLIKTVAMIPFIGWIPAFLAVCIAFGAIWLNSGMFRTRTSAISEAK